MPKAMAAAAGFWVTFAIAALPVGHAQSADRATAPTFSRDVAPIFYANCTTCHRPGEIAPMSLVTYKDARPWARSIAMQVGQATMPPWHADPAIGRFANERRLSDADKSTILRWVEAGAPEGDPNALPPPPKYADGWNIGEPDVVLSMQEDYPLPASGTIPYLYFEVPANFAEDRWITAWEMRPGNRAAVHHVIVTVKPPPPAPAAGEAPPGQASPGQTRPAGAGPRRDGVFTFAEGMEIPAGQTGGPRAAEDTRAAFPNYRPRPRGISGTIGGYVPGNSTRIYPPGTGIRLPAGSSLVFQMHYTPTGQPTTDRTRIGLVFARERPKTVLQVAALINGSLHVPPGAADHRVDAEMTINRDILLFGMTPHTHVRGKRWRYDVVFPDGRRETILSVPNYDFDWQHEYQFREPLKLPKGTRLQASAWYDNSKANAANPDPTKDVWWGDQTWEEMMFTALTYSAAPAGPQSSAQP